MAFLKSIDVGVYVWVQEPTPVELEAVGVYRL